MTYRDYKVAVTSSHTSNDCTGAKFGPRVVALVFSVLVPGIIVVVGACGSDSVGGQKLDDADAGTLVDTLSVGDVFGDSEEARDTLLDASVTPCEPGETACTRGVRAQCEQDGLWHYAACPAGEVCDADECVVNKALVVIAVESPTPSVGPGLPALPATLEDSMRTTLCAESPSCCETFGAALDAQLDEAGAVATKYWIRRVVLDLSQAPVDFTLLAPPTADAEDTFEPSCNDELQLEANPCLGGSEPLMSPARARTLYAQLPVSNPSSPEIGLPVWNDDGSTSTALDVVMAHAIKGNSFAESAEVLAWVDGIVSPSNPELNAYPSVGYSLPYLTYLYLGREARPDGRACREDSDCPSPHYRCTEGGLCRDAASACRVVDVVSIGSYAAPPPTWSTSECWGGPGGIDPNIWSQWLRWGLACEKHEPCWPGSVCKERADFFPGYENVPGVCFPEDFDALVDSDRTNFVAEAPLARFVLDHSAHFPSYYAVDVSGRRFSVRTHSIFIAPRAHDTYSVGYLPLQNATATAVAGDGVAVTPCAPGINPDNVPDWSETSLISCDYEAAYEQLIEKVRQHGRDLVCSPQSVGLPAKSQVLLP